MKLVIVRHAEPLSRKGDPARGLSPHRRDQARAVGRQLSALGVRVAEIRHSTKARAQQTAEIIAAELDPAPQPEQRDGLKPNDPVEPVARDILDMDTDLMLVSHLPFVQYLTSVLISHSDQDQPPFPTCGTLVLTRDDSIGSWSIEHVLVPRV